MISRTEGYKVVINHEEQYSIIPIEPTLPRGLQEVGKKGTQSECLKYIEEVWADMKASDRDRILSSLRR